MAPPKWKIGKLTRHLPLKEAADKILSVRVRNLRALIRDYLRTESAEGLHQIRIALRRLRYSMELFSGCYPRKKFFRFYERVEVLQDTTGSARDLFILKEKLSAYGMSREGAVPAMLVEEIARDEQQYLLEMRPLLEAFFSAEETKEFRKLLH